MLRRGLVLATQPGQARLPSAPARAEQRRRLKAFRDPGCECCRGWVRHMAPAEFDVRLEERPHTDPGRRTSGAPPELMGCQMALYDHTAFEGHVLVDAIRRFLAEPGPWRGLAVPGMPVGSPGMEVDGVPAQTYNVVQYDMSGRWELFATVRGSELL